MAQAIVTLTIMPETPEVDLKVIETAATREIKTFGGDVGKVEIQPVAFGLKALKLIFVMDEAKGSTESLEQNIARIPHVQSCETTDVRRAIG